MNNRLNIAKTYKLYIDGKFVRSESGRFEALQINEDSVVVNICRASRKDFRNAVSSSRKAVDGWWARTAYNRSQILYRIAETMDGRKEQFLEELQCCGMKTKAAEKEFETAVDRFVYYAGWADKFQQLFSTVNPVSSSHFNFSLPENQGVVAIMAPISSPLTGLVSLIAPAICAGNTVVCLTSGNASLAGITLAEALHASDVPAGVVNLLTGIESELAPHFASHLDVNGIVYGGSDSHISKQIEVDAAENLKRVKIFLNGDWSDEAIHSPYDILQHCEIKTTWHPIGT
ncbi:MAG: aldehyde dehydrogenase family protein [Candidatus Marinimicrobia bacterium]|jgi:acyl-CoA reductase-like NAD-dependent aldehyde dehydrogenase|nr:aldehyde dehydrogenase family protein [Candidatus Neomarinimicrobiota bacterium]MDP6936889.1 aldehyde dehydrogenase family protein [Candidatus Neomarinimicrobiota bacterium]